MKSLGQPGSLLQSTATEWLGIVVKGTPNVVRRAGTFHFRRAVPNRLRERLGRGEITLSLRTKEYRLARVRSRHVYIATESFFRDVESASMLTEESLAALVQDFQALLLEIDNMFRLTEPAVSDEQRRARLMAQIELREEVQSDLGRGDYTTANLGLEVVIARSGRKLDELA